MNNKIWIKIRIIITVIKGKKILVIIIIKKIIMKIGINKWNCMIKL